MAFGCWFSITNPWSVRLPSPKANGLRRGRSATLERTAWKILHENPSNPLNFTNLLRKCQRPSRIYELARMAQPQIFRILMSPVSPFHLRSLWYPHQFWNQVACRCKTTRCIHSWRAPPPSAERFSGAGFPPNQQFPGQPETERWRTFVGQSLMQSSHRVALEACVLISRFCAMETRAEKCGCNWGLYKKKQILGILE